jgi:hypothetical protein
MGKNDRDPGITRNFSEKIFKIVFVVVSNKIGSDFRIKSDSENTVFKRAEGCVGKPGIVFFRAHELFCPVKTKVKNIFRKKLHQENSESCMLTMKRKQCIIRKQSKKASPVAGKETELDK